MIVKYENRYKPRVLKKNRIWTKIRFEKLCIIKFPTTDIEITALNLHIDR